MYSMVFYEGRVTKRSLFAFAARVELSTLRISMSYEPYCS